MPDATGFQPAVGDPVVTRHRWQTALVWMVPAVAALIGLSMLLHAWLSAGPEIAITFRTAAGLEAGKTPVKYRDVTVGVVSSIALGQDGSRVVATVSLDKSAASLVRADTRFWVVRPRIGVGGVSGIDTLLTGAYIGLDKGTSTETGKVFAGLETPPAVIGGMPGKSFTLDTDDLGSLDIGSPVYYRHIQVGRVTAYDFSRDGQGVRLSIFVDAPYDRFVRKSTRFWNASGIDVSLSASGLKLNTQSLATVVAGGIAFATPPGEAKDPAPARGRFVLARDEQAAMARADGPAQHIQLRFGQSLRGLSVRAPVEFFGFDIGRVASVSLDYDPARQRFSTVAGIEIYPQRLGQVWEKLPTGQQAARLLQGMVERGLRAQARPANLLTGQLYIALDFVPDAPRVAFDIDAHPLVLPTVNGSFDRLQEQVASIIGKIDRMPLESIGRSLDATLSGLNTTIGDVNGKVMPEAMKTLQQAQQTFGMARGMLAEDAPLLQTLGQVLQEAQYTARSLRALTDMLGRHPEALLRGRRDDPQPGAASEASP